MFRVVAFLAALVSLIPIAVTASEEDCIQLAYFRPHRPQVVAVESHALFNDVNAARAQRGLPPLVPTVPSNFSTEFVTLAMWKVVAALLSIVLVNSSVPPLAVTVNEL